LPFEREEDGMPAGKPALKGRNQKRPPVVDLGFSWSGLNTLVLGLGIAMLVAGYVALSRGSITLAPALLILGYCGFVPASLLIRARKPVSGE
jgi:hypothetical protein